MVKNRKKSSVNLPSIERIIFAICAVIIILTLILLGPFYILFVVFASVLAADLALLLGYIPSEAIKRTILLISILTALFAVIFVINVYYPYFLPMQLFG